MSNATLSAETETVIRAHAAAEYPREACGLIAGGRYVPCRNAAPDPRQDFMISPRAFGLAEVQHGRVDAVVHSHVAGQGPEPSGADREAQRASGLPWFIVEAHEGGTGRILRFSEQEPTQ